MRTLVLTLLARSFLVPRQSLGTRIVVVGWVEERNPTQVRSQDFKQRVFMSAKDFFHNTVRTALKKDDWTITDDPLFIQAEDVDFYIDLAAERILAAEKTGQKIAVEVKSFLGASEIERRLFYG